VKLLRSKMGDDAAHVAPISSVATLDVPDARGVCFHDHEAA
jgi:hypothetical protein